MCPSNVATGGPELLHQLAFELKRNNAKVFMLYINSKNKNPVHENYKEYMIDYVYKIEDNPNNLVILPEVYTSELKSFMEIKTIIWWLSVDNYFKWKPGIIGYINRFLLKRINYQSRFFFSRFVTKSNLHLVQSRYAEEFLKEKNVENYKYLSDFLHKDFLNEITDLKNKKDIVAYNPKKGSTFTKGLIAYCKDIVFVPIQNMTRAEVVSLLKTAKVYIDFGNHPGKDRIPREAAILQCCVITGKKGSAKFFEDVPIPNSYKFEDKKQSYYEIRETIIECFENFDSHFKDFNGYRDLINIQQSQFENAVQEIFFEQD